MIMVGEEEMTGRIDNLIEIIITSCTLHMYRVTRVLHSLRVFWTVFNSFWTL